MSEHSEQPEQPDKPAATGPVLIPVPWSEAEGIRSQLKKEGVGSTAHFDPASKQASLELWPPQEEQGE
jgi:hypothetical protein